MIAAYALIAGPASAMSEGGCNWSASFISAETKTPQPPVIQALVLDARG